MFATTRGLAQLDERTDGRAAGMAHRRMVGCLRAAGPLPACSLVLPLEETKRAAVRQRANAR
jgi:hypothetical protein